MLPAVPVLSYIYPMSSVPPQVFFIDDDKFIRQSTTQSLEMAGFAVESFADAEAALEHIDYDCDRVVISDIKMPRLSGLDLLQRIKEVDPGIPVILITGQADIATAVQAMRDGA